MMDFNCGVNLQKYHMKKDMNKVQIHKTTQICFAERIYLPTPKMN